MPKELKWQNGIRLREVGRNTGVVLEKGSHYPSIGWIKKSN